MANWAYTSYAVEGPKEVLEKLYDVILTHPISEGADGDWEGDILNAMGCTWVSRDKDRENGKYMRGFISEEPWWNNDEHTCLRFCAEEAWGATDFNEVLEENLPVRVYYSVEESGEGIYATNDEEGEYFPDKFYVDMAFDNQFDSDYFISEEAMNEWLRKNTEGRVTNKESAEKFNNEHTETGDDDENFISIYEIAIVKS